MSFDHDSSESCVAHVSKRRVLEDARALIYGAMQYVNLLLCDCNIVGELWSCCAMGHSNPIVRFWRLSFFIWLRARSLRIACPMRSRNWRIVSSWKVIDPMITTLAELRQMPDWMSGFAIFACLFQCLVTRPAIHSFQKNNGNAAEATE